MEIQPDLSLCIVAPGRGRHLHRFLRSAHRAADHVSLEIFIIGSPAESDALGEEFPQLVFMDNREGRLPQEINKVLGRATGRYVSLWDDEAVMEEGCLTRLVEFLDDVPDAGIAGPKMRDEKGGIQPTARQFPGFFSLMTATSGLPGSVMPGWHEYGAGECHWFAGSGMTVSRYLLDDIGGVSNRLSLYWPIDFCLRARRSGWHVHYRQDAQAAGSLLAWQDAMTCSKGFFVSRLWEAILLKCRW